MGAYFILLSCLLYVLSVNGKEPECLELDDLDKLFESSDPRKYYQCFALREAVELTCPYNYVFKVAAQQCVDPIPSPGPGPGPGPAPGPAPGPPNPPSPPIATPSPPYPGGIPTPPSHNPGDPPTAPPLVPPTEPPMHPLTD